MNTSLPDDPQFNKYYEKHVKKGTTLNIQTTHISSW